MKIKTIETNKNLDPKTCLLTCHCALKKKMFLSQMAQPWGKISMEDFSKKWKVHYGEINVFLKKDSEASLSDGVVHEILFLGVFNSGLFYF